MFFLNSTDFILPKKHRSSGTLANILINVLINSLVFWRPTAHLNHNPELLAIWSDLKQQMDPLVPGIINVWDSPKDVAHAISVFSVSALMELETETDGMKKRNKPPKR